MAQKLGLPANAKVWHMHPLALMENFGADEFIELVIKRQWETPNSTISTFEIKHTDVAGYFLERPGPDTTTPNMRLRIPEGVYKVRWHNSGKFGKSPNLYNESVAYTRYILIHGGNDASNTDGCLLAGSNKGVDYVSGSQDKLKEIRDYLNGVDIERVRIIISNDF